MSVIETLATKIRQANKAYWQDNKPVISDLEYDKLVEQLRKLDPKNPVLNEIGSSKIGGEKIKLWKPHLSLGKTYNRNELLTWAKKVSRNPDEVFMVSPKYDGITIIQQGDEIVGRGDGYVGQRMTNLADQIDITFSFEWNDEAQMFTHVGMSLSSILEHCEDKDTCTGELVISEENFSILKQRYPEIFKDYKNCRNFIAGFANSKCDAPIRKLKGKHGYPIRIGMFVLHRAYEVPVTLKSLEDPQTLKRLERILRDFQGYPTDGLVFRLKDEKYAESLGETAHHPRGAIALKWTSMQLPTVIKKIEWDIGQERLTPTAVFEPLQFPGHLVQRATLHCAKWLHDHHACVGSKIVVEYAGGVIPKVVDVEYDDKLKLDIPQSCPYCGGKLEEIDSYLICTNEDCTGKAVNKIQKGLEVFGIKGVGPALINKVVHELYINNIIDWFRELGTRNPINVDFLKKKGFTNHEILLLTRIEETQEAGATPIQLLMSVCIPKCGREFCETVERKCGGIMKLVNGAIVDRMYDHIVGKCNLDSVTNFMCWMEEHYEDFIDYVSMFKLEDVPPQNLSQMKGTVCFTGAGPKSRHELTLDAMRLGYVCTENVNQCGILVCEDPNGNSSKLKKAREKGIKIMSYEEFFR